MKRRIKSTGERIDLAAFEVDRDVIDLLGFEPINIERVHDGGTGKCTVGAKVIGYPFAYRLRGNLGEKGFCALSYGCEPIEPERWPAISDGLTWLDKDIHLVVCYGPDTIEYSSSLPLPPGLPAPNGMSGGGFWHRKQPLKDGEIWTADALSLFGIQSSVLENHPFLIGIQIIHWLKLVADEYPDIRAELHDRFPRLKELEECD